MQARGFTDMRFVGLILLSMVLSVPALFAQTTCAEIPEVIVLITLDKESDQVFLVSAIEQADDYELYPSKFEVRANQTIASLTWFVDRIELTVGNALPQHLQLPAGKGMRGLSEPFLMRFGREQPLGRLLSTALCGARKIEGSLTLQRGLYPVNDGIASIPVSMSSR